MERKSIGYIMESESTVCVVFRGTATSHEFQREMMVRMVPFTCVPDGGHVHKGLFSMYSEMGKEGQEGQCSLRETILQILGQRDPRKKLYITGFSMGAALATMCAVDVSCNSHFTDPSVYTFASSRVGDKQFVRTYNQRIHQSVRVVNRRDCIPMMPPNFLGYHHVKGKVTFNIKTGCIGDNHRLLTAYFPGILANLSKEIVGMMHKKNPQLFPFLPNVLPAPVWRESGMEFDGAELTEFV